MGFTRALAVLACATQLAWGAAPTISSTSSHVLVSKGDGAIAAWGSDFSGKLGTGRPILRTTPGKIAGLPPITQIASYTWGYHFVARDTNGRVWTWGQSDAGQLGPRVQRNASIPGRVMGISNVVQVAATAQSSMALKADGTVWVWGSGVHGTYAVPTQVQGLSGVVQITASSYHYFARKNDGSVWGVGYNSQNQLGVGAPTPLWDQYSTPTLIPLPANVLEVAATVLGGMARTGDGKVWSWGSTDWGSYGEALPREVTGFPAQPTALVGGTLPYQAVLPNGTLWRWENTAAPTQVAGFSSVRRAGGECAPNGDDCVVVDTLGRMYVRGGNAYGERGLGTLESADNNVITQVPSPTDFTGVLWTHYGIMGVTTGGEVWTWGAEVSGSFGDGAVQTIPVPRTVAGVPATKRVVAGHDFSAALDETGAVWAWGMNAGGLVGTGSFSPTSTPVQIPLPGVKAIAAGWYHLLMVRNDGSVWMTGFFRGVSYYAPTQIGGLAAIKAVAAGSDSAFALGEDGRLWAWGENIAGELGVGDRNPRVTPVEVAVPGGVTHVATEFKHVLAVNTAGDVYGWGEIDTWNLLGVPSSPGDFVTSPQKVAGISGGVVEVAAGQFHSLARRADGVVLSWGPEWQPEPLGRDIGNATPPHVPSPVLELDSVVAIAAANAASYAIRNDGTVWGWGLNWASGAGPTVGDGTFVRRSRPVVVIREDGAGNLDTNDWFLDAKPGTPKSIPPAKVPSVVSVAQSLSSSALLNVDGSVKVRIADQGKTLGLYVTGLVPAAFLSQPGAAPGAQAKVAGIKADTLVLVNLTAAGWTLAAGQLEALKSGVGSALSGATSLLVNINPATIPGARFCIGYGESATDMLKTGAIRDFLSLAGASTSALGLPCLLSGVYMDGPRSSPAGSAVPIRAVVVGQAPTGNVRFREGFTDISTDVSITPVNSAVSDATFSFTPAGAGEYAFGARYGGNGLNTSAASAVPLRHVVRAVQTSTTTRVEGPVTSEIGLEVVLIANIVGNRPSGTVQFKRGGVNQGAPIPVSGDQAVISVVGLGIGTYGFTAEYSGDVNNASSVSAGFSHQVLDIARSAARLGSASNPARLGDALTLTATVSGTNPTGTVTLRERAEVRATKSLASGSATFTLTGLSAGVHVFAVDYSGDGNNPASTSNAVFQQVTLDLDPLADLDGDGIPNAAELAEGRNPQVKDNDVFANARLFAMQQYRDFLGREGDAGGVAFWTDQINTGAQTRAQSIESFFGSAEFQGTIAPVARLYFAYFLRIPEYEGINFWIGYYRAGNSLEAISNFFAGSPEFTSRYGALDNAQFVTLVYNNVLGRAPDGPGLAYWKGRLDSGALTRGQVMLGFSESAEYRQTSDSEIYVTMMYIGMLRRAPEAGGFSFWVQYRDDGNSGLALINGFLGSSEYRGRFLP